MKYSLILTFVVSLSLCCKNTNSSSSLIMPSLVTDTDQFKYFESFDGLRIAYMDEGKGEVVVLFHGFINDATNWNKSALKLDLIKSGYRVIIPDLRGNGRSGHPHDRGAYKNNAQSKDIIALADYLKIDEYFAVGYSRGSIILGNLLKEDPRIKKCVIGGMGISFTNPDWELPNQFARAFLGEEALTDITRGAVEYAQSINADLIALGWQQEYQPTIAIDDLKDINIPMLILAGDQDDSNGNPKSLAEALPKAEFKLVEGDHNNTYKSPSFAKEVIDFLN